LRIIRILVQEARGRRLTPVAPNAYAPYRGFEVREPILRIQTAQGLEGIAHNPVKPEILKRLLGLDAFELFDWEGDLIEGAAEKHRELLGELRGADIALLDLLAKAIGRPVASLLGKTLREKTPVYDSSLYMEDLLKPSEWKELAYLTGPPPKDPAQMVARKASWIVDRPEGVQILKIKIGRTKWMGSFEEALDRDIAVYRAVRKALGKEITLFVDGNNGYDPRPLAAADFAQATGDSQLYAMEEMFSEKKVSELREVKKRLRTARLATKIADGEDHIGGLPEKIRAERFDGPNGAEPLIDIDQADMNASGFLRLRASAHDGGKRGMTLAPHNFGSKMGLYAQIHLALVIPNWEFCESDDSQFPALEPRGFIIEKGVARLTGEPGLGVKLREEMLQKPAFILD
jgi:L-alanine-DL-glutamate epimerase-like enolase superfamily enzyme